MTKVDEEKLQGAAGGGAGAGAASVGVGAGAAGAKVAGAGSDDVAGGASVGAGAGAAGTEAAAGAEAGAKAADFKASSASASGAKKEHNVSRRSLIGGVASAVALLGIGAVGFCSKESICRPPGGQDEDHLMAGCIRCEKCYEVCPRHVISPANIEHGIINVRTPTLDFSNDYCDFCAEENGGVPLCEHVCPTDALKISESTSPNSIKIGTAEIDIFQCLAYRDTGCRFCYDACVKAGYNAIELKGVSGAANPQPVVLEDKCVGCGACQSVCVSLTEGSSASGATEVAIVVRPKAENNQGLQ